MLRGEPTSRRKVWAYAITIALTILTHATALVVVAAHGLCWLWQYRSLPAGRTRWVPFAALVLGGVLTVVGYAPAIPQMLSGGNAGGSAATSITSIDWQNPAWFLAETIRALMNGIPAGIVVVPIAGLVALAGLSMAWRRDRLATVLMLLPLAIMALMAIATGHNLWPRFFFFGAAFLVQMAVRGGFGILELIAKTRAPLIGNVGLAAITVASLAILPRAWGPKQDYEAAVAWVEAQASPGDAIVATNLTQRPVRQWLGRKWPYVTNPAELVAIEATHPRTWVLYTFPIYLAADHPELWKHLEAGYSPVHRVSGTVGGGEIVILSSAVSSPTSLRKQ
jgi:hypothetical protein